MAHADILLIKPVAKLGHEGEQVKVKAGYARNFLYPQNLAVPVTRANSKQIEALHKRREERLAKELSDAQQLADKIAKTKIAIAVKTGPGGKLFGSVTNTDVVARLAEEKILVPEKVVLVKEPLKTLGLHTVEVKLPHSVTFEMNIEVVSENPIEEIAEEKPADEKPRKGGKKGPRKPRSSEEA